MNTPLVLDPTALSRLTGKERHWVRFLARRANRLLKGSELARSPRHARMNRQEFAAIRGLLGKVGCLS